MINTSALTDVDFEQLLSGKIASFRFQAATLRAPWVPIRELSDLGDGAMPKERRFVMEGPSGTHSLLVAATDLDRLNAHWTVFCDDERNLCAA